MHCDDNMFILKQVGYTLDYVFLLQSILWADQQGAVKFALMLCQMEGGCPVDYNTITDLFLQRNMIHEATKFLLDVLKLNLPEHAFLQTRVLEINLVSFLNVADVILANGMFNHYKSLALHNYVRKLVFMCEHFSVTLKCLISSVSLSIPMQLSHKHLWSFLGHFPTNGLWSV